MGLSAGLIDDLLLLPQDYRSSSPGGEGNSSEHSGERERERGEGTESKGERDGGRERGVGGISMKMEEKIEEGRWEEKQRERKEGRGTKIEGIGRARWRQRGEGGDIQMCS